MICLNRTREDDLLSIWRSRLYPTSIAISLAFGRIAGSNCSQELTQGAQKNPRKTQHTVLRKVSWPDTGSWLEPKCGYQKGLIP